MNKKIVIGSRGSKLALIYAQTAKDKIVQNTHFEPEDFLGHFQLLLMQLFRHN